MSHFVYLSAGKRGGRLYSGIARGAAKAPALPPGRGMLLWYEAHHGVNAARAHRKRIRGWARACKISLIEKDNAGWRDLALPGKKRYPPVR